MVDRTSCVSLQKGFIMSQIRLKRKAERSVRRFHPWVFSGAVDRVEGAPGPGDIVRVVDSTGQFLAWGHYNPRSRIRVRLLDWMEEAVIDEGWWRRRLRESIDRRSGLFKHDDLDAFRLVFGESDLLPGLIIDRYAGFVVLQAMTAGVERVKPLLAETLGEFEWVRGVLERSDADSRRLEGLEPAVGPLWGDSPPERIEIREHGFRFLVDVVHGQKTGFFLDQRANRRLVDQYAAGREVLDCFSYTGGFAVYAAWAGAGSVTLVESSAPAVDLALENFKLNNLSARPIQIAAGDVFRVLREYRDQDRAFDLIILDPPKFAPTRTQAAKATRAYKDINLLALKLLRPDGVLATFSCSGGVEADLFQKIVFGASLDAGREVQILEQLSQGTDHPVRLSFPESFYLKGLICKVL